MRFAVLVIVGSALLASSANAAYIANITIDGNAADWSGMYQFRDRNETTQTGTDIPDRYDVDTVYVANDGTYLYWAINTYGAISGNLSWRIYVDPNNDTASGGGYGQDDRYVEFDTNNGTCQAVTVHDADNNAVRNPAIGCGNGANINVAFSGTFIEGRILLSRLFTTVPTGGNLNIGVLVQVIPNTGNTATELAPGQPLPSFIDYDNRGTLVPTFVRVRGLTAEAAEGGVLVRWRTSAEYFSAGTWVVRASGDDWVPVSGEPSATQNQATGDSYAVVDANGGPGDIYALVEVDSRTIVRVFGPVTAVKSAVTLPTRSQRLASNLTSNARRIASLDQRLRVRTAALDNILSGGPLPGRFPQLDVDVTREGLFVVCDSDTLRYGGVPAKITRGAEVVRGFAVSTPCAGLGFYAPAPSSPYAPFDVYRVQLAAARNLSLIDAPLVTTYDGPVSLATLSTLVTPRRYLDMRDGQPNRFFWSYASTSPSAPVDLPAIPGYADMTVDVHPLSGGATHTLVVATDRELGRYTVGDGWSRIDFTNLAVNGAPALTFVVEAEQGVIETVLLADATVRYRGEPAQAENGVHFGADGDSWVGVRGGEGFAFDVTQPRDPSLLVVAPYANGTVVHTQPETRDVFIAKTFTKLQAVPTLVDAFIDEPGSGAEYLVLTPASLVDTARELAQLRAEEGMSTAVLSYEAVYARFTGSNPDPTAVAKLLDWAAVRWSVAPRYLVLVGSTSSDPYGYTGSQRLADAPIAESLDPDFTYRRFSDRDLTGSHQVAVGRIPTSDAYELGRYVEKLRAHRERSATGVWSVLAGASTPDEPSYAGLVNNIAAQVAESVTIDRLDDATTVDLVNAWGAADVIAYAGHGDAESWADDVLYTELAPNLVTERPPVTLSAACMDAMTTSANGGLAWSLVSAEVGRGSIAAIAPSSIIEPIRASAFLGRAAAAIAHGEAARWGDAWLLAQMSDTSVAARSMVLIGDPALSP